ncbi:universal stress protein [Methylobacterium sp.]|uniref:universal stress protein n=1 Tax=Methylobacterium sp. TaxID=409 RepID=UPI003B0271A8
MSLPSSSLHAEIRDVLVCRTEEGRDDEVGTALSYGLSLAAATGAHLTVQSSAQRLTVVAGAAWGIVSGLVAGENLRRRGLARSIAECAATDAATAGVICTTEVPMLAYPDLLARLVGRARLADLTILDAESKEIDLDRDLIDGILFRSGRPLLVVPPGCEAYSARRILVAWDGSAQAARAANDALPFLRVAEHVEVVSVVGEKDLSTSAAGAEFAPHLARHGVSVSAVDVPVIGDVAETLRTRASQISADMLVMGAFRHSRIQEWFLGGVTQSLLNRSPIPLFLAH